MAGPNAVPAATPPNKALRVIFMAFSFGSFWSVSGASAVKRKQARDSVWKKYRKGDDSHRISLPVSIGSR
jgi:hypothetical protein